MGLGEASLHSRMYPGSALPQLERYAPIGRAMHTERLSNWACITHKIVCSIDARLDQTEKKISIKSKIDGRKDAKCLKE